MRLAFVLSVVSMLSIHSSASLAENSDAVDTTKPSGTPTTLPPKALPVGQATKPGAGFSMNGRVVYVSRADLRFAAGGVTAGEVDDITTKKPKGIALEGIATGSTYGILGFRDHDILISVNGHPMQKVSDLNLIETSVKVAKYHEYKVERGQEVVTWRVEFEEGKAAHKESEKEAASKPLPTPERVTTLKKELLKTLDAEPSATRLAPEYKPGGAIRCFRVVNVTAKSAFKRAGLASGDCIFAVNGTKFDQPPATLAMFDQMRGQIPMTFEIERRGEKKVFRVEFE